jgi:hypothetical protein
MTKEDKSILKQAIHIKKSGKIIRVNNIASALGVEPNYLQGLFMKRVQELRAQRPKRTFTAIGLELGLAEATTMNYYEGITSRKAKPKAGVRRKFDSDLHHSYMFTIFGLGGFDYGKIR